MYQTITQCKGLKYRTESTYLIPLPVVTVKNIYFKYATMQLNRGKHKETLIFLLLHNFVHIKCGLIFLKFLLRVFLLLSV